MEQYCGHLVQHEHIDVGGRSYELLTPARGEALLDDPAVIERFERDEYMPYWAMLWPAAVMLADIVATWEAVPQAAREESPTVLELGCGLGLVGMVAAARGYRVTVSDVDTDALAFAAENVRRNGLPKVTTREIDWRTGRLDLRVNRILAADVLYEERNLKPVAEFVRLHLARDGFALVCDPNRRTAETFAQVVQASGLKVATTRITHREAGRANPIGGRVFRLWCESGEDVAV